MNFDLKNLRKRSPSDIVCLDFGTTGVKAVRLKNTKTSTSISAVDILPPIELVAEKGSRPGNLNLPKHLTSNYAAISTSSENALAKLINLPQKSSSEAVTEQIREQFNIDDSYRVSFLELNHVKSKSGLKVLAAALPENEIHAMLSLTAVGPPAPHSLEISCLSALTAFFNLPPSNREDGVCFLEMGALACHIFFIQQDRILLLRKYDVGGQTVVDKIVNDLHVDRKTAVNIMCEGAIDISSFYLDTMGFIARQITISRDFVERQENCRIQKIYMSGGMASSQDWMDILKEKSGLEVESFDPFQGMDILPGAFAENEGMHPARFTAAIGAGLGVFEKDE